MHQTIILLTSQITPSTSSIVRRCSQLKPQEGIKKRKQLDMGSHYHIITTPKMEKLSILYSFFSKLESTLRNKKLTRRSTSGSVQRIGFSFNHNSTHSIVFLSPPHGEKLYEFQVHFHFLFTCTIVYSILLFLNLMFSLFSQLCYICCISYIQHI